MKLAIVTGGTRGIGRAIAMRLRADGYELFITGSRPRDAVDLYGLECAYLQAPAQDEDTPERVAAFAMERFGRIDVLVNNAGMAPRERADLLDMTRGSMREVMEVNLFGPFFLTQRVSRQMERQGAGVIINVASVSSDTVSVNRGEYCMSKAALSMMTQLFAARMAACGVYVYEVRPGVIRTDMTAGVTDKYDALFEQGLAPIARWGEPDDVAAAVAMLASGALRYSTGEVVRVDGGMHIRRL